MQAVNKSMGPIEWLMLVILSILWGGSFFFIELAIEGFQPFTIVFLRVGLAALMLHLIIRVKGQRFPWDWDNLTIFLGMGFLNSTVPFTLIVWGQTHITGGLASILNATTPLFTIILAHLFTQDDRLTRLRVIGIFLGILGVSVIIGLDALEGLGVHVLAQAAVLMASLFYGLAMIFLRRFKKKDMPLLVAATGNLTASTVLLFPLALLIDQPWQIPMPEISAVVAVFGLAFFSTTLAFMLYFRILFSAGATNFSLVTFLIPISSIMLGYFFLGEQLESKHFVGMGLIGLGLVVIDGRVFRRKPKITNHDPLLAAQKTPKQE